PTFREVRHHPAVPEAGQPITISGLVADPDGVASVRLRYSVNGGGFESIEMDQRGSDGEWRAQIPGQSAAAAVRFYLGASDAAASPATSFFPAAGRNSRALFRVDDGRASASRQNLRVIMTSEDSAALHAFDNMMSNYRFGCTIISNESEIFYECGIRMRGSMWTRNAPGDTGFNYKFPADKRFRGVHDTITTRRRGVHEVLPKHIINHAGGLHDDYNDIVQLIHSTQNGVATRLSMARHGNRYLNGLPGGNGADGHLFRMDGQVFPTTTTDGTPEGIKRYQPVNWNGSFDISDQGDDKERYRHNIRLSNNFEVDDFSSILAMAKSFDLTGQELEDTVAGTIDVDMWMRQFALTSLLGIGDTYTQGSPHNLIFYARPSDGIVEPVPWDWDFFFARSASAPLWGNGNVTKIIARPVYTRLFHGHLLDLIDTTVNLDYMSRWFAHYGSVSGQSYGGFASSLQQRVNFVLSQIPAEIPFSITTNGGTDFETDDSPAVVGGRGWVNVRELWIDGADTPLEVAWLDGSRWQTTVPLQPGPNALFLRARNHQGREVGRASITITNTGSLVPASRATLAIGEVMYHPADGGAEYIELLNTSESLTIDLTGIRFTDGIDYSFPAGTQLSPGARLVITQSQFQNNTRLANEGERVTLVDAGGGLIFDFRYRDGNPWPEIADGGGFSLVRSDLTPGADLEDPLSWRPSVAPGGNPGTSDLQSFPGGSVLEYALVSELVIEHLGTRVRLSYRRHLAADEVALAFETSGELLNWQPAGVELTLESRVNHGDGTETLIFETTGPAPFGGAPERYLRVRATVR
ncbi:MAG: lamin tail domain-containing protein, partial [Verrucomicrobia bacterium]|nr:lamin tail domain-containing protein [Verrucomicrobiota bacterium]